MITKRKTVASRPLLSMSPETDLMGQLRGFNSKTEQGRITYHHAIHVARIIQASESISWPMEPIYKQVHGKDAPQLKIIRWYI